MIGGQAPMALAIMWSLTAITLVFVVLRFYTRAIVLRQVGWDDHIFVLSGILLLFYTIFINVSATYGFGQAITSLSLDDAVLAVKWEMVGQTFAVIGMATAKVSLGLFLLRLVLVTWHKVALWVASLSLLLVSIMTAIIFWIQCLPSQSIFDPRVKGLCIIEVTPFSILLGSWCAAVDFFFAAFPWIFIWKLNMKYREKVTIAASMSLGVVAGICGIVRTVELSGLQSANYTEDTVNLNIWSAAELAITMVCAGIPVLRPLLRRGMAGTSQGTSQSSGYYKHGTGHDGVSQHSRIKLDNLNPSSGSNGNSNRGRGDIESNHGFPNAHPKLGIRGATTVTLISRDNHSDEEILGPEYRHSQPELPGSVQIRERIDVRVEEVAQGDIKTTKSAVDK